MDLFNNDICNIEDYRTKVFKLLPNLKFLDDADADDNDEEESDDEGANGAEEGDEDDGEGENSKIHHRFHEKNCFIITFNFFIDDDDEVEGEEDEEDSDELSDEEGMWDLLIISDIWFLFCVSKLFLHIFFYKFC